MTNLDKLKELLGRIPPAPWRAGRQDTVSHDGSNGDEPYKAVYVDDPRGGEHRGETLAFECARGYGMECRDTATAIATLRNLAGAMVGVCEAARELRGKFPPMRADLWMVLLDKLDTLDEALKREVGE